MTEVAMPQVLDNEPVTPPPPIEKYAPARFRPLNSDMSLENLRQGTQKIIADLEEQARRAVALADTLKETANALRKIS